MSNVGAPAIDVQTLLAPPVTGSGRKSTAAAAEQRVLLHGIDWAAYQKIAEALTGSAALIAYQRGAVEVMTKSRLHEIFSRCLDKLIGVLAEEMDLPLDTCGEMTCEREDLLRAIEPDSCFYITHEPQVRGKARLDLRIDPPPDLAVEVDISRSSEIRMPTYAALGVPEVWRFDGTTLAFLRLGADGTYASAERSRYFTVVTTADLLPVVLQRLQTDEMSVVRSFRAWLKQRLAKQA